MSENTTEKQLISLLLEFLDISRTTIRTWILYGILQVQEQVHFSRENMNSRPSTHSECCRLYFWPSCTQPFHAVLAKYLPNGDQRQRFVHEQFCQEYIKSCIRTVSSVESTDAKPGTKPDTTAGIYGKKASRIVLQLAICRNRECTLHRPRS